MALAPYLGVLGDILTKKNQGSKISRHCPIKLISLDTVCISKLSNAYKTSNRKLNKISWNCDLVKTVVQEMYCILNHTTFG
jgi:hypothetical protein